MQKQILERLEGLTQLVDSPQWLYFRGKTLSYSEAYSKAAEDDLTRAVGGRCLVTV